MGPDAKLPAPLSIVWIANKSPGSVRSSPLRQLLAPAREDLLEMYMIIFAHAAALDSAVIPHTKQKVTSSALPAPKPHKSQQASADTVHAPKTT